MSKRANTRQRDSCVSGHLLLTANTATSVKYDDTKTSVKYDDTKIEVVNWGLSGADTKIEVVNWGLHKIRVANDLEP